jgi:hypothetical protein
MTAEPSLNLNNVLKNTNLLKQGGRQQVMVGSPDISMSKI